MKIVLIIVSFLIVGILVFFTILANNSKNMPNKVFYERKLQTCPITPNCVISNKKEIGEGFIKPLKITTISINDSIKILEDIILELNGEIIIKKDTYISAIFSSSIFGFVDDLELKVNTDENLIYFRSASRVGKSDFGANKKRLLLIEKLYKKRTFD